MSVTEEKYGLKPRDAILLFIQMILVTVELLVQVVLTIFLFIHQIEPIMIVSSILLLLSLIAMIVYAVHGFRTSRKLLIVSIGLFLLAVLFNLMLPRNTVQIIMLVLIFACLFAFIFEHKNIKVSNCLILAAAAIVLSFSIYSSITANVSMFGELENPTLASILMYLSIFTPTIMIFTFGISHFVRSTRRGE